MIEALGISLLGTLSGYGDVQIDKCSNNKGSMR